MEGQDLTAALTEELVAVGPAFHDQAAMLGLLLVEDDILPRTERLDFRWQVFDGPSFLIREVADAFQATHEQPKRRLGFYGGHDGCAPLGAEAGLPRR